MFLDICDVAMALEALDHAAYCMIIRRYLKQSKVVLSTCQLIVVVSQSIFDFDV